ncbi:uncharacterized protein LOC128032556 [Gossypium raimondii]|uniref:uncharacterized protein LOC128032556 n=1 Tax=Gossypium raimondii TaxID=29730 RepID=UPI00227C6940|nr:uncharacterized protein LOC128032556 [Gossypium raimondii]
MGNTRRGLKESTVRFEARAPTRAYAIRAREETSAPNVIAGAFSIFDTNVNALIDSGSTHSNGCNFLVDLMLLPFDEFDMILGIDWVLELKLESVPTVCEFKDVFPEKLLELLPVKEVDFSIELMLGTSPISIAPYRMTPTELKELKAQLLEFVDRGFVWPSFSPWGALVFVATQENPKTNEDKEENITLKRL